MFSHGTGLGSLSEVVPPPEASLIKWSVKNNLDHGCTAKTWRNLDRFQLQPQNHYKMGEWPPEGLQLEVHKTKYGMPWPLSFYRGYVHGKGNNDKDYRIYRWKSESAKMRKVQTGIENLKTWKLEKTKIAKNERTPKKMKIWKDEKCENLANPSLRRKWWKDGENPKFRKSEKTKNAENERKPENSKI